MTCKTDEEKQWFWKVHDRIEGYHSSKKQIVPIPTANVPTKKQTYGEDLI